MKGKEAYPILISLEDDGMYFVQIPDFEMETQGESIANAMEMARDEIGIMGITLIEKGKDLPIPNSHKFEQKDNDIYTLVDIDFIDYRKKYDNKSVKKNCTIPYWLSEEAGREGLNYSKILQEGLKKALNIEE